MYRADSKVTRNPSGKYSIAFVEGTYWVGNGETFETLKAAFAVVKEILECKELVVMEIFAPGSEANVCYYCARRAE
jgi:hypothetical protein